jgi:hypothetical protein
MHVTEGRLHVTIQRGRALLDIDIQVIGTHVQGLTFDHAKRACAGLLGAFQQDSRH